MSCPLTQLEEHKLRCSQNFYESVFLLFWKGKVVCGKHLGDDHNVTMNLFVLSLPAGHCGVVSCFPRSFFWTRIHTHCGGNRNFLQPPTNLSCQTFTKKNNSGTMLNVRRVVWRPDQFELLNTSLCAPQVVLCVSVEWYNILIQCMMPSPRDVQKAEFLFRWDHILVSSCLLSFCPKEEFWSSWASKAWVSAPFVQKVNVLERIPMGWQYPTVSMWQGFNVTCDNIKKLAVLHGRGSTCPGRFSLCTSYINMMAIRGLQTTKQSCHKLQIQPNWWYREWKSKQSKCVTSPQVPAGNTTATSVSSSEEAPFLQRRHHWAPCCGTLHSSERTWAHQCTDEECTSEGVSSLLSYL